MARPKIDIDEKQVMKLAKVGRPKIEIDEEQIKTLASLGCTYAEIGSVVGCSAKTIQRNYVHLIKEGHDRLKVSLRRWQYQAAEKGNTTLLIWLGKQYLDQRDEGHTTVDGELNIKHEYGKKK